MTTDTPVKRQDCHVHINCAHCINCQHTFMVAHNPGQLWYTCPECKTNKAHLQYTYTKPDASMLCDCGNHLFVLTKKGAYCPNCGKDIFTVEGDENEAGQV